MYRLLLTILLCLKAASAAPQAKESDVTYVKIQPIVEDTPVAAASNIRESRIEKLPLTIPGDIANLDSKEPDKNVTDDKIDQTASLGNKEKTDVPENQSNSSEETPDPSENLDVSASNQSDTIAEATGTDESVTGTTNDFPEVDIKPTDDLLVAETDASDIAPSETNQSDRQARIYDSLETTTEDATETIEDIETTVTEPPRTRKPPKFHKAPKLSYFQKPRVFHYSANHLEIIGKRKFRSRCSCQKIWNCPKLQITVPRCPNEYFLCCF